MRIPDRAEWKVLIEKVLYTGVTGIFNWDGYKLISPNYVALTRRKNVGGIPVTPARWGVRGAKNRYVPTTQVTDHTGDIGNIFGRMYLPERRCIMPWSVTRRQDQRVCLYPSQMILPVWPACKCLTIKMLRYTRSGIMIPIGYISMILPGRYKACPCR